MSSAAVDWSSRLAKRVERHMLVETARRLEKSYDLACYSYVGLGALQFMDFELFHRALGIEDMVSIESNTAQKKRYEFNKPFRTVRMVFDTTHNALPTLKWGDPAVVWLDFDGQLGELQRRDLEYLAAKLAPGSLLFVTLSAESKIKDRLCVLRENLGERIPADLTEADLLRKWSFAEVQRDVACDTVDDAAANRLDSVAATQVLDFVYKDNARMQTIGWVFCASTQPDDLKRCDFPALPYTRATGQGQFEITVPHLTVRERYTLQSLMPVKPGAEVDWLAQKALAEFGEIYRYYPEVVG